MEKKVKNRIITAAVIGFILLLTAGLILFSALYPMLNANKLFYGKRDLLERSAVTTATVYDPEAVGADTLLTPGKEVIADAAGMRELLLRVLDATTYSRVEKDISLTDYDYRLRFRSDAGTTDFFVKGSIVFIVDAGARYCYNPKDMDAFSELTAAAEAILRETDS